MTKDSIKNKVISVFKLKPKTPTDFDDALNVVKVAYPRIHSMITIMWGTRELNDKLCGMLSIDSVDREGFPAYVATALMTINDIHMTEFGFEPFHESTVFSPFDKW